jgi:hypothetical protein
VILRYAVHCPGCGAKIVLRLGVGLDLEQPFYFVCKACNAATKGKLIIWYKPEIGHRLELEEGTPVDDDSDPAQVVTLHPDMPSLPDATEMWDAGGSPFLLQRDLLKGRFIEWHRRLELFRLWSDREWPALRRLIGYYLDSNWDRFDAEGQRLLEQQWPNPKKNWQRHDCLHRILDLAFVPLWIEPLYPNMKKAWFESSLPPNADDGKTATFCLSAVQSGRVNDLQRTVFHCLELFVENRGAVLPALAAELYPKGSEQATLDLRLFRDDFAALRDLYVATFESCHKVLYYVVGQLNIAKRGDANAFLSRKPGDLSAFEGLPNAEKARRLVEVADLDDGWRKALDRGLRNVISHQSVRHDLSAGMLVLENLPPIPYLQFVVKTLRVIHPILFAAHVLKTMNIMALLGQNLEPGCPMGTSRSQPSASQTKRKRRRH